MTNVKRVTTEVELIQSTNKERKCSTLSTNITLTYATSVFRFVAKKSTTTTSKSKWKQFKLMNIAHMPYIQHLSPMFYNLHFTLQFTFVFQMTFVQNINWQNPLIMD